MADIPNRMFLLAILPFRRRVACWLLLALPVLVPALGATARAEDMGRVLHVLNRLTYGPTPGALQQVASTGAKAFITSQLEPERLDEPAALTAKLATIPSESMSTVRLFREFGPEPDAGEPSREALRRVFDRADATAVDAARARLYRAILSRRQLFELMVAFWSDHFSLGPQKGLAQLWVGSFEREAIRPHALGHFLDLLAATAMHPAMLIAGGNWKNVVQRQGSMPPQAAIDTRYAAFVLGRQTLGPKGPYKPEDVQALARILTGWRVGASRNGADRGGFYFDQELHDPTDKQFLGHTIQGSGVGEGAAALRLLARHPATAAYISRKLIRYFLCAVPPPALVKRMAATFTNTDGDIREVLRTLFTSAEFFDPKYRGNRLKSPLRQVVSAVRAIGAVPRETSVLAGALAALGQPLYGGHTPSDAIWRKPEGVIGRVILAGDLVSGRLPVLAPQTAGLAMSSLLETLGPGLSVATRRAATRAARGRGAAVLLGSPDFMRY